MRWDVGVWMWDGLSEGRSREVWMGGFWVEESQILDIWLIMFIFCY